MHEPPCFVRFRGQHLYCGRSQTLTAMPPRSPPARRRRRRFRLGAGRPPPPVFGSWPAEERA
eukprot:3795659-Lingulodinium_polyedra.AAC.1